MCIVEDCGLTPFVRGMCSRHYSRWKRHGDPLAGPIERGLPMAFFLKTKAYAGNDCIAWPYAKRGLGRGAIHWEGKTQKVHRVMCQEINGPPPSSKHHAAHSCGNGHLGCITPNHLDWKTAKENEADKLTHGTLPRGERSHLAKLSNEQVDIIREISPYMTRTDIAKHYGVSVSCISGIILMRSRR